MSYTHIIMLPPHTQTGTAAIALDLDMCGGPARGQAIPDGGFFATAIRRCCQLPFPSPPSLAMVFREKTQLLFTHPHSYQD